MYAQDMMTRKVRTADLMTPIATIAALMVNHGISAVPIVDKNKRVLGIVSERDLLRRAETGTQRRRSWWSRLIDDPSDTARDYIKVHGRHARDVMSRPVISVTPTTSVAEIIDLMEKWDIKRVPVVRSGRLVGIVSRRDLMRAIAAEMPLRKEGVKDAVLRDRLQHQLRKEPWLGSCWVNFVVEDGIVDIFGVVQSKAEGEAVRVMAENIKGVFSVNNRLTVLSPRTA